MSYYLVTIEPGDERLVTAMKAIGVTWARINEGTYVVKTDMSVVEVRDTLKNFMSKTDKSPLFVVEITGSSWAGKGLKRVVANYLKGI